MDTPIINKKNPAKSTAIPIVRTVWFNRLHPIPSVNFPVYVFANCQGVQSLRPNYSRTNSSSETRFILFTARARTNRKLDNRLMYGSTSGLIDSTFDRATILLSALLHTALAT